MKKILIVADTYFPKIDGIMRFLQEVTPRISDLFDITMLVPDFGVHWKYAEIKIKPSRIITLSGYPSMAWSIGNIKKIRNAVRNSDTVFVQGPAFISILAILFGRRYRKTVIHFTHLIMWELYEKHIPPWSRCIVMPLFRNWIVRIYNMCDVLMLPYKNLIGELEQRGITSKKEIARLGVDTRLFLPSKDKADSKRRVGIDPSYMVVGYVGRISKEKNVAVLVDAVTRIPDAKKIITLIVGSGPKRDVRMLKTTKNIVLPGFQKNVVPYFQAMDIFVMPSLTETTSLATLEAMACGVPVITTKVGFLKEYVMKDYNGLFFPGGNANTLQLQITKLLKQKRVREHMGRNARTVALSFSWDKTAQRIKEILIKY